MNPNYFYQETDRLILRRLAESDIPAWAEFFVEADYLHFLGMKPDKSPEEFAQNWIQRQFERYETQGHGLLAIVEKETGALTGQCGLLRQTVDEQKELEIGYSFIPRFWGKGYATEAAQQFRQFAFTEKMAPYLISIIHTENRPSQKVAIRNGMQVWKQTRYKGMEVEIFRVDDLK